MNRIGLILWGSFLVLSLALLFVFPSSREFVLDLYTQQGQENLKHFIYSLGFWGPIVSIFLMVLHSIIFIPSEVVLFANIYLFGFYIGLFYTWVGSMLGAYLSFYLARFYGRPFIERFHSSRKSSPFRSVAREKRDIWFFYFTTYSIVFFQFAELRCRTYKNECLAVHMDYGHWYFAAIDHYGVAVC